MCSIQDIILWLLCHYGRIFDSKQFYITFWSVPADPFIIQKTARIPETTRFGCLFSGILIIFSILQFGYLHNWDFWDRWGGQNVMLAPASLTKWQKLRPDVLPQLLKTEIYGKSNSVILIGGGSPHVQAATAWHGHRWILLSRGVGDTRGVGTL